MRVPAGLEWWRGESGGAGWLDRDRMRRWGIAHALAWGLSDAKLEPDLIECARLLRP